MCYLQTIHNWRPDIGLQKFADFKITYETQNVELFFTTLTIQIKYFKI